MPAALADQAASSVTADDVARSQRRVAGQLDVDAGAVLREAHHLTGTKGQNAELTDPVSQDALEVALPQRKEVAVAGGEVADVQEDPGVAQGRVLLPRREESPRDATLIEHLDGARVKTPGSRSVEILTGASFDDDDIDPRQRQLARQHQPGRTASCDHHRMLGHRRSPPHAAPDSDSHLAQSDRAPAPVAHTLPANSSTGSGSALPVDQSAEDSTPIPQLPAPSALAVIGSANES